MKNIYDNAAQHGPQAETAIQSVAIPRPAGALDLRKVLVRQLPALAVILALVWLLKDRIAELDVAHIRAALATVGPAQWVMGLALTAISFWSLGQYDLLAHRLIGRDTGPARAAWSGMTAIALGQTLGVGAVTGALVRWRMLPELRLIDATKISALVSLSFIVAWAVVTAMAVTLFGAEFPFARLAAGAVLGVAWVAAILSVWRPGKIARLPLPSLKAMALILVFTLIDTLAAGAVLWTMLPEGVHIPLSTLLTAYLLALGAGLVLTTPGGVGPFEVALIALLPAAPTEPLLAAVLAYRALYYAVPAVIAGIMLARRPRHAPPRACRNYRISPLETCH